MKLNGWDGETPAYCIKRMVEFHEGKDDKLSERLVEVDDIIESYVADCLQSLQEENQNLLTTMREVKDKLFSIAYLIYEIDKNGEFDKYTFREAKKAIMVIKKLFDQNPEGVSDSIGEDNAGI